MYKQKQKESEMTMSKIEIPFDSKLQEQKIQIPNGYEASIEGGKIILRKKESEDEKIRKAIINEISLKEREVVVEEQKAVYKSWISWLEKQGQQKPSEWSEEDELFFNEVEKVITYGRKRIEFQNQLDWLKSLKQRLNKQ